MVPVFGEVPGKASILANAPTLLHSSHQVYLHHLNSPEREKSASPDFPAYHGTRTGRLPHKTCIKTWSGRPAGETRAWRIPTLSYLPPNMKEDQCLLLVEDQGYRVVGGEGPWDEWTVAPSTAAASAH